MTTTNELDALIALQDHDLANDQALHRRSTLPERRLVNDLTAEITRSNERVSALRREHDDLSRRQREIDAEVTTWRVKQGDLDRRLAATSVAREAQVLQHELEVARDHQRTLEDDELAVMESLEPVEVSLREAEDHHRALAARHDDAQRALVIADESVSSELDGLGAARPARAAAVPDALLRRYESLRPKLGGIAVARLAAGRCTGCNLALPTSEVQRLRSLAGDELGECEQCGRMLVVT